MIDVDPGLARPLSRQWVRVGVAVAGLHEDGDLHHHVDGNGDACTPPCEAHQAICRTAARRIPKGIALR